jgi:hypothetical protein
MKRTECPSWNPSARAACIRKWAEHLHKESKEVFLKDKTHANILFLFGDDGLVSITQVPPKSDHAQIQEAILRAVKERNLYAVVHIGEAWTYFPKTEDDHTLVQLLTGEMRVRDLKDADKTEALVLRMESRDGDCVVYVDKIVREDGEVVLREGRTVNGEDLKWFSNLEKSD